MVSMSWGGPEFTGMANYDNHFNRPGVTFTASSGDSGAGVEWPAVSPYVVGVGGTTLYLDNNGNRTSETAWSGSGGGTSAVYSQPSYQTGWQTSNHRGVPDVSLLADPKGSPMANTLVPALAPSTQTTNSSDFSIGVSPGSSNIKAGNGASYHVTITATGGFGGNVSFTVGGLPGGATASFSPSSVAGSGSATLSISTSRSTLRGTYPLTVRGTSGSLTHSVGATLRVR